MIRAASLVALLALPAASITTAFSAYVVALTSVAVVMSTYPALMCVPVSVVALPSAVLLLYSCTVSPASAFVPVNDTRTTSAVSSVDAPVLSAPVIVPTSSVTDVIVGAFGAIPSTTSVPDGFTVNVDSALPAASVSAAPFVFSAVTVRSDVLSPEATVYVNTSDAVPEPLV